MSGQKGGPPDYDNYHRERVDWNADEEGVGQATWFRPDDRWDIGGGSGSYSKFVAELQSQLDRFAKVS